MSLSGFSESTVEQSDNPKSIASLVYAGGHLNGYLPPTKLDIPQLRVPQLEAPPTEEHFRTYQAQLKDFEQLAEPSSMPSLDSVPNVYRDTKFSLDNPRVFAQVVGTDEQIDYSILLEKLSWYIDVVELHLLENISNASSSFFQVTSQFNEIESSAAKTTTSLVQLRESLDHISQFAEHETETLELVAKLHRVEDLASHLGQLKQFCIQYKKCKQTASDGHMPDAVPLIAECRTLLKSPHDLTQVNALANPIAELDRFEFSVGKYYQRELVRVLLGDFNRHVDSVPVEATIERIGRILHVPGQSTKHNHNSDWLKVDPDFRERLSMLLDGAFQAHVHMAALNEYKDTVFKEVKALVRMHLPQSNDPDRDSTSLASSIKALSGAEFERIVKRLFACLSESFRRVNTQSKLLLDLCSHLGFAPPTSDLLESLVSSTDTRLAKILRQRTDLLASVSVPEFMRIYSLCGIFMSECESVCSIYAPELAAYLAGQTKLFVRTFASNATKLLTSSLDLDPWKKDELPPDFQTTTDLVVESGEQDPVIWLREWRSVIDGVPKSSPSSKKLPQNVFVKDDSFFVSRSAVKLVLILSDLLELTCLLPQTTSDLTGVYIQLISLFDSRTRALILGTGAMTSGSSIKRISFRHLSLAYESIRFVAAILSNSSGCVQRHLQDSAASAFPAQCGSLADSLRQHQVDISKKFISVMEDKAKSYTRSIAITNWETCQPPANHYMQMLVKDISTVSRILEDTLNKQIALGVVSQIFDIYKPALLEAFTSIRIPNTAALENVMQDIRFFRDHMQDIKGGNNIGEVLFETISAFASPEDDSPPAAEPPRAVPAADMTVGDVTELDVDQNQIHIQSGTATPQIKRPERENGRAAASSAEISTSAEVTPEAGSEPDKISASTGSPASAPEPDATSELVAATEPVAELKSAQDSPTAAPEFNNVLLEESPEPQPSHEPPSTSPESNSQPAPSAKELNPVPEANSIPEAAEGTPIATAEPAAAPSPAPADTSATAKLSSETEPNEPEPEPEPGANSALETPKLPDPSEKTQNAQKEDSEPPQPTNSSAAPQAEPLKQTPSSGTAGQAKKKKKKKGGKKK